MAAVLAGLYLLPIALTGQGPDPWAALFRPRTRAPLPTEAAITPGDLMTRVYLFADDSLGGRILDSRGNVLGVEYIARELAPALVERREEGEVGAHLPFETRDQRQPLARGDTRGRQRAADAAADGKGR